MGKLKKYEEQLMQVIGFTEKDLEANRDRYMTKSQRTTLSHERSDWRFLCYSAVVVCPVACVVAFLYGLSEGDTVESRTGIISLICMLTAIFFTYCYMKWRQYDADLSKGDVAAVEGPITLTQYQDRNGIKYTLRVQSTAFNVNKSTVIASRQGCS